MSKMMKVVVFIQFGCIELVDKLIFDVGLNDVLVCIIIIMFCGIDVYIFKGEYLVVFGLMVGYELVGIIEKFGSVVVGYCEG